MWERRLGPRELGHSPKVAQHTSGRSWGLGWRSKGSQGCLQSPLLNLPPLAPAPCTWLKQSHVLGGFPACGCMWPRLCHSHSVLLPRCPAWPGYCEERMESQSLGSCPCPDMICCVTLAQSPRPYSSASSPVKLAVGPGHPQALSAFWFSVCDPVNHPDLLNMLGSPYRGSDPWFLQESGLW